MPRPERSRLTRAPGAAEEGRSASCLGDERTGERDFGHRADRLGRWTPLKSCLPPYGHGAFGRLQRRVP